MRERPNGSAALVVMITVVGIVLAAANVAVLVTILRSATGASTASASAILSGLKAPVLLYFIGAPLVAAVLLMLLALTRTPAVVPAVVTAQPAAAPVPSPALALRLLGLLQQEGRLVDFVQEDIDAYSDEQVGAAVRSIHAGCRKVLQEHVELQRISPKEDGSEMVVEKGFDPAAVRLTGNVTGEPPFRGTLQHGGWRVTKISLPESTVDPTIIAPAEVEIA